MTDTEWIATCSREVASATREVLDEVVPEMDLLKKEIIINPYPAHAYRNWHYDLEDKYIEQRMDVVRMLVKRGVLKSARLVQRGGEDAIFVTADREPVVLVRSLLMKRGTPEAQPGKAASAQRMEPKASPTSPTREAGWLGTFREEFIRAAGTAAGKAVMGVIGFALAALIYYLLRRP